ncbi:MAG: heavy-metal-associated domain-containing protein [Bacillota bacterium]|jgi:copper chaperone
MPETLIYNNTIAVFFLLIGFVFLLFGIKSHLKKLTNSNCCGKTVKKIKVKDQDTSHYFYTVIMQVDGIICKNCTARIENALNKLEGVWAEASIVTGRVTIRTKLPPDNQALQQTINTAGPYKVIKINK